MTKRDAYRLRCLQLCDLYTRDGGITYRDVCGDRAEIFAVATPEWFVRLQANVYPFHMLSQPFTVAGLERCKNFVRRWVG